MSFHYNCLMEKLTSHTVDRDGNALVENESIGSNEGGDLSESVDLQVLGGDTLGDVLEDLLDVKAVGLGHNLEGGGAGVVL